MFTEEEIKTLKNIASDYQDIKKFYIQTSLQELAFKVCKKHDLTLESLKSKERTREHVIARVEFTKRAKEELGKSISTIGRFLNRDFSGTQYYVNSNHWKSK